MEGRERSGDWEARERERSGGRRKSGVREWDRKESCGREGSWRRVREGENCGAQSSTYPLHFPTVFKFKFKTSNDI